MKNLYTLPTDKPSRLVKLNIFGKDKLHLCKYILPIQYEEQYQNIYITSEENIKEGDWVFREESGMAKYTGHGSMEWWKKIILTTDQSLDGVQPIDDDFLEWFLAHPSCEEVLVFLSSLVRITSFNWKTKYKIIIPKEFKLDLNSLSDSLDTALNSETKESLTEWLENERKETALEEAAERLYLSDKNNQLLYGHSEELQLAYKAGIFDGAKWQQKNSYSKEEVKSMLYNCCESLEQDNRRFFNTDLLVEEIIKQFKKK